MPVADLLTTIKNLEPFPRVATRVLQMSAQPDLVPNELIDVIRSDPGITAKLLKLANSSFYGSHRTIDTLSDAGNLLGVRTIVALVTSSCTSHYMRQGGGQLWERCLTNAVAARLLAQRHKQVNPERAFTAGLLQDIGELVVERYQEGEREAIRAIVMAGGDSLQAEREVLGLNHADIGARLANRWCLPEALVDTIRHHHLPSQATRGKMLASTTHLAETVVAPRLGKIDGSSYTVCAKAFQTTGLSMADLDGIELDLERELDSVREALAA